MYSYDSDDSDDDYLNVLHMSCPIIRIELESEIWLSYLGDPLVIIARISNDYLDKSSISLDEEISQTLYLEKQVSTIWYDTSLSVDHDKRRNSIFIRKVRSLYDTYPLITCTLVEQDSLISVQNLFNTRKARGLPRITITTVKKDSKTNDKDSDLICYTKPNSVRDQIKLLNESNAPIMRMKPNNVQLKHLPGVEKPVWVRRA